MKLLIESESTANLELCNANSTIVMSRLAMGPPASVISAAFFVTCASGSANWKKPANGIRQIVSLFILSNCFPLPTTICQLADLFFVQSIYPIRYPVSWITIIKKKTIHAIRTNTITRIKSCGFILYSSRYACFVRLCVDCKEFTHKI